MIQPVVRAFGRALWSQLHYRMLLLTLMPFILSLLLWGVLLWLGLQPMIDAIQAYFVAHDTFAMTGNVLGYLGLGAIKTVIVPLIAMWVLLPLMILTALLFIGLIAMPVIVKHVASRTYSTLQERKGGSLLGSLWNSFSGFASFLVLWLLTLPLALIPPFGFIIQPVLWGWLTYRVMAYDALAGHADDGERKQILREHRWPLLTIGVLTGAMGAAPTLLWLGGALAVVLFPLFAVLRLHRTLLSRSQRFSSFLRREGDRWCYSPSQPDHADA